MKAIAMEEVVLSSICRVFGLSHNLKRPAAISATRMLRLAPLFTIKMKSKHRFGVDRDASRPKRRGRGTSRSYATTMGTRCKARSSSRIFILQSALNGLIKISRTSSILCGGPEFRAHRQCYDTARYINGGTEATGCNGDKCDENAAG